MLAEMLRAEFDYEIQNTRKLLQSVPADTTAHKITGFGWSLGQLAQHIATIHYWYVGVMEHDEYDFDADAGNYTPPENNDIEATKALFEKNATRARELLQAVTDEDLNKDWSMKAGGKVAVGPMKRAIAIRSFLFNHVYHHRGELIVYLRSAGAKVPGLYGPTYEQSQSIKG